MVIRILPLAALILGMLLGAAGQGPATSNVLTLTGTLKSGVMAVGAETTGITLTVARTTFELEIKDAELRKKADSLDGKSVTVKGTLTIKQGVEVAQRRIITVESLEAAKESPATTTASAPASQGK